MEEFAKSVSGLIVALVTAAITYFFTRRTMVGEYKKGVTTEVWKKRSECYGQLMNIMRSVPKWPSDVNKLTFHRLDKMSTELKDWYFDGNGLYLSDSSFEAYGALQTHLCETVLGKIDLDEMGAGLAGGVIYEQVRKLCSTLRSQMAHDLRSRSKDMMLDD